MYANNLFTVNNLSTLPVEAVSGNFGCSRLGYAGCVYGGNVLHSSDRLFVNVVQYGKIILDSFFEGYDSVSGLMAAVRQQLGSVAGLITVNIRNCSQGWSGKRIVRLNRVESSFPA